MPIPPLDTATGYLPVGDHPATWPELEEVFGSTYRRRQLLRGLRFVVDHLRSKGVRHVWVDGSFTTDKLRPRDVDVIYERPEGADVRTWGILAPQRRMELKRLQEVDLWCHPSPQPKGPSGTQTLHDLWATDRSGKPKGMVVLTLNEEGDEDDQE